MRTFDRSIDSSIGQSAVSSTGRSVRKGAESRSRVGGVAALYLAAAYLAAMPFFLLVVDYPAAQTPADKVALLAAHQWSVHAMYLVTYVLFGIALAMLALVLHDLLQPAAAMWARMAAVLGVLWGTVLVASGMIFNYGMSAVVDLHASDPERAAALWQPIESVSQGLGGGSGELLGGLWVLTVSLAGLGGGGLPRPLGYLGLVVGIAGLVSVIPVASQAAYVFGLLQLVWFAWLGITLLRAGEPASQPSGVELSAA